MECVHRLCVTMVMQPDIREHLGCTGLHIRGVFQEALHGCSTGDGSLPDAESGYAPQVRVSEMETVPVLIEKLGQHAFHIACLLDLCLNHIMMIPLMEFLNRYKCGKISMRHGNSIGIGKQVPNITDSFDLYSVQIYIHQVCYSIAPIQYALRLR
ncbi:hypothetical protein BDR05DRAFT_594295 [Suillus weaverae]|nr:hypothetical protein BDR05DRAFT_594295 [Suillus weaverae]